MANTYFKMKLSPFKGDTRGECSKEIELTAFMGNEKQTQITIDVPRNTIGFGVVVLTKDEAFKLAMALLERYNGDITATGEEKSKFTDDE